MRALALHGDRLFLGGVFGGLVDGDRKPVTPRTAFLAELDASTGPTVMLAGPKALYVGGTFKNILPRSKLDGGKGIPHPGFAMFPAN